METEEQAGHDGLAAQGVVQPVLGYGLIALNTENCIFWPKHLHAE